MRRVIDCLILFDELDLLEFRLRLLKDLVDCHVIVEHNLTHSGREKPFYFERERARFDWARDRIVYIQLNTAVPDEIEEESQEPELVIDGDRVMFVCNLKSQNAWREFAQRNVLGCAINMFNDSDIILMSDVDEFPTRELLSALKYSELDGVSFPFVCEQEHYHYSLKWRSPKDWWGTVVTNLELLKRLSPQEHRNMFHAVGAPPCYFYRNGGWHLSYFLSAQGIKDKVRAFAHQNLNKPQYVDQTNVASSKKAGTDMWGLGIRFKEVEPDLPDYFRELMPSFPQLFDIRE